MAGITLVHAETMLALWLAAEEKLAAKQEYEIEVDGTRRRLKYADLAEVSRRVSYWDAMVKRLTPSAVNRPRTRSIVN